MVTALTGAALYNRLDEQNHQEFLATVDAVREAVAERFARDGKALTSRISALVDHPIFRRLASDLNEGVWTTRADVRKQLEDDVAGVMKSASIDVLWVLDNRRETGFWRLRIGSATRDCPRCSLRT